MKNLAVDLAGGMVSPKGDHVLALARRVPLAAGPPVLLPRRGAPGAPALGGARCRPRARRRRRWCSSAKSRATGSRWRGVQGYWLAEAGAKTASHPTLRQMELKLKKMAALCYATDESLQDAPALEGLIRLAFSEEFAFMLDDAIFEGNGVGQPLGIMNSPALVTVAAEVGQPANTILFENIVNMYSRGYGRSRPNMVWLINQDIEPQLFAMSLAVGVGGIPVYLPANGLAGSPYGSLLGRPVIPIEYASTLGTTGDIMLADLSQYLRIDKSGAGGGIQAATSIHVKFLYDETAFRFVYRVGGQPMWNLPLTPFKGANTLSPYVVLATRP